MAKKKQQKKTAKKAAREQPRAKKKAAAKKSLGKQVKTRPAAKKATPKKISMPPVAGTAFLAEAPSGTPIGLDRATQIVKTCAMGADLGSTIGDLPDPGGFGICIGNQTSGCNCPDIPLSSDTKLLVVVAAVARCTCS
jgi:hypothetical protein